MPKLVGMLNFESIIARHFEAHSFFDMFDNDQYRHAWRSLNRILRRVEAKHDDLGEALEALYAHQLASGFVRDDLSDIKRYVVAHPEEPDNTLLIQFNPKRAQRFHGNGKKSPPAGQVVENAGCFLCPSNIAWQQDGAELGYDLELNDRKYIAWINPFPLAPAHAIVASPTHRPQAWHPEEDGSMPIGDLIADLAALVSRASGYLGFYNGIDAGASIPGHLHFQCFRRPDNHPPFPIEKITAAHDDSAGEFAEGYPVTFTYWRGRENVVVPQAVTWARAWYKRNRTHSASLSANIMAINHADTGEISLYFVPRTRAGDNGDAAPRLGGLEMLGELVFSSAEEKRQIDSGQMDYFALERILAHARSDLVN